jgi:hypothetical protein
MLAWKVTVRATFQDYFQKVNSDMHIKIRNLYKGKKFVLQQHKQVSSLLHLEVKRKTNFPFVFHSFFRNFARFLSFSLYKGSLGDWGKSGLRIGNRTQFHILLWIAFNEHPMMCHQPFYGSSSGAKVIISLDTTKCYATFLWVLYYS